LSHFTAKNSFDRKQAKIWPEKHHSYKTTWQKHYTSPHFLFFDALMDFSSFSDENFNAKTWVNNALLAHKPSNPEEGADVCTKAKKVPNTLTAFPFFRFVDRCVPLSLDSFLHHLTNTQT
jgi:hypothetical protein